ncbi:bestrophin-like domain [Capillimicrobium parvum]|uniref:DUF4239 domain-containing protein n=1 Tax=Capillimicrobium parvum TaxID=2884022 RepID=A0A9E7BY02_9ACTN|nr:DUF4239 domain-containing protein [Capillimicrobium parvum]UGS34155.1 hypothetical protein DSM104329_00527 [Capillimicrobium parvum]
MVRDLLNAVPEWALALAFIGAIVALALGAFRLVCHFLARWRDQGSVEGVLGLAAMVMTLFALVLAFVVVNLYSDYTSASSDVTDEANALGAIVQDARAFPDADRLAVERAIARYTAEVRDHEFDTLAEGRSDPHANALVVGIVEALQAYAPQTETQKTFYGAATDQLNTFLAERENRVAKAETSIPGPLLGLLIFLSFMTVGVFMFVRTHHGSLDVLIVVVVAVVVASGLLTALILQYPYSGSIAVSSDPFTKGLLAGISGGG